MNAPGDTVDDGRFELIERLGSGGMGTVWRARDTVLHREVALKAVRPDAAASDAIRERVLREARALARLSHPHVVTVHHIVDADPHPWIVMELVPGSSLLERLADGPLPPAEAARLGRQILSALRAAHAAGIQHRDVKPANVLLRPDGSAVLTDFGIAALEGSTSLTVTGELVGSPEYMAPERIRGHGDDPASDLWSLGLVLYVCVEGVNPLRRATTLATLAAVLDDPLPPPVRSGPLAPVLQALLVRDPAARPEAERLDAMLARVESEATPDWERPTRTAAVPPPTEPVPPPAPTRRRPAPPVPSPPYTPDRPRPRRRTTIAVAVAVAAVLAIAATATLFLTLRDPGDKQAGGGSPGSSTRTAAPSQPRTTTPPSPTPSPTPSATDSRPATGTTPPPPTGRWIAQLYSEPVGTGTAARDLRLAKIRRSVPEAKILRSDKYASLRPGYWVVYAPGPFADGRAALAFCAERGRTTANTCIGRYLSESAADSVLQCRPPATQPTGRCTRP
ncbi:serine/threonine-protein kinase [Streptomyces sp. NBC_01236]|uniref:serine/threonine-protein kinase n=1 Tax=Streptomyces sp. NBC_01236 TaxID=2903789 RepID=UPI002E1205FE|nr:serine/threonine protein kinase [Streptomyces sp. NBC_01236]